MKKNDDDEIIWVEDGGKGYSMSEKIRGNKMKNDRKIKLPRTDEEMKKAYEKAYREITIEESLSMYDEKTRKWFDSDEL